MDNNPHEQDQTIPVEGNKLPKDASPYTIAANKKVLEELNFSNRQDYHDARRGLMLTARSLKSLSRMSGSRMTKVPRCRFGTWKRMNFWH
jgi:alkyl sulfatase BDS1-like metallo-beta-lactamase superfamily hydrolase